MKGITGEMRAHVFMEYLINLLLTNNCSHRRYMYKIFIRH